MTDLQAQLDNITTQTRALVQPERLAITDTAVRDLFATGIEDRILPVGATAPSFSLPDAISGKLIRSSDLLGVGPLIINAYLDHYKATNRPLAEAYPTILHIMSGLLVLGFIANLLVHPVSERFWIKDGTPIPADTGGH